MLKNRKKLNFRFTFYLFVFLQLFLVNTISANANNFLEDARFSIPSGSDQDEKNTMMKVSPDIGLKGIKYIVIGLGQGGSQMASAFYDLGYRKVVALNTNKQDFKNSSIPEENRFVCRGKNNLGGAGKNPNLARSVFEQCENDIFSFLKNQIGDDFEHVMLTIGAGGGTGNGFSLPMFELVKEYMLSLDKSVRIGAILSMPRAGESARVESNASSLLLDFYEKTLNKELYPLVISDNKMINKLFPNISAKAFWPAANRFTIGAFDVFNMSAAMDSDYMTFDAADYLDVLQSGVITFGASLVPPSNKETLLSDGFKLNLERTMSSFDFNLKEATHVAAIIQANDTYLSHIPMRRIDDSFESLQRLLNPKGRYNFTLHQGVYEHESSSVHVYTMVGGLTIPESTLTLLKQKSGR